MARRRSPVPIVEWNLAFSYASKLIAEATRTAMERKPELFNFPLAGAVVRWAFLKAVLPKLREALAKNPGIESPDEIKRIVFNIISDVYPRSVAEMYLYTRPVLEKYVNVDKLAEALEAVKEAAIKLYKSREMKVETLKVEKPAAAIAA